MTTVSPQDALHQIEAAFARARRPPDDGLLHESCSDDGDIEALYGIPHWRDMPDDVIEREYAALFFLSPAGFRHFLPAYLSWALLHPESNAAVIDSTIFALTPATDDLREFSLSKFTLFDSAQRSAVVSFLEAMAGYADVENALAYWRSTSEEDRDD